MLFAVEGGGFFSSSASGYSKFLTLLLLGQKKEEKPMRVTPWNQYQLVDQETDSDIPLASAKNRLICGCASIVCFGSATARLENPSPLKVGPTHQQDILQEAPTSETDKVEICSIDNNIGDDSSIKRISIKSSLRKPKNSIPVPGGSIEEHEVLCEAGSEFGGQTERRRVQWTDSSGGGELVEIREFEPSDDGGSDEELDNGNGRTCSCAIM